MSCAETTTETARPEMKQDGFVEPPSPKFQTRATPRDARKLIVLMRFEPRVRAQLADYLELYDEAA